MTINSQRFVLCILLVLIFTLGSLTSAQEPTTVSLTSITLAAGEAGVVEGQIECAADGCAAFAITITFDPSVLRVDSIEVGSILGEDVFVAENVIDNDTGSARLVAVALADLPETDDHALFHLSITAIEPGITVLNIDELEVGDLLGNPLEVKGAAGAVVVTAGEIAATPEETAEPAETPEVETTPEITNPCFVYIEETDETGDENEVFIRVGPGYNRGVRAYFPTNVTIPVVGEFEDDDEVKWWKIQPPGYLQEEADRYWVAEEDVEEIGDCEHVGEAGGLIGFVGWHQFDNTRNIEIVKRKSFAAG
jgi:hypothetical protein